jgi:hypothetical protein
MFCNWIFFILPQGIKRILTQIVVPDSATQININEQLDSNAYVMVRKYGMPALH